MSIMKCMALLSLATLVTGDFVFNTSIFGRGLYFEVRLGNDTKAYKVHVDSNRPYSFLFHKDCKSAECTTYHETSETYDPSASGGTSTDEEFRDERYDDHGLKGKWFKDTLKFNSMEFPVEVGAAMETNRKVSWSQSGVIGLGVPTRSDEREKASIVKDLMSKLSTPLITIQEGDQHITKKGVTEEDKETRGSITFGKYDAKTCDEFTFTDSMDHTSWRFKADITIGKQVFSNQTIAFAIGQFSFASGYMYDKYFSKKVDNESELSVVSFKIGEKTFEMTPKEYAVYDEYQSKKYSSNVFKVSLEQPFNFAFGSEFLQKYCVAFRADKEFKKLEIGLAVNNGRPKEKEERGTTPPAKSAAGHSISFALAVISMLALH